MTDFSGEFTHSVQTKKTVMVFYCTCGEQMSFVKFGTPHTEQFDGYFDCDSCDCKIQWRYEEEKEFVLELGEVIEL